MEKLRKKMWEDLQKDLKSGKRNRHFRLIWKFWKVKRFPKSDWRSERKVSSGETNVPCSRKRGYLSETPADGEPCTWSAACIRRISRINRTGTGSIAWLFIITLNREKAWKEIFTNYQRRDERERMGSGRFCLCIRRCLCRSSIFGHAIITRLLESRGYRVGIIAQPDWRKPESVQVFGEPRLGFLVSAGNMDSMVNHYSVSKKEERQTPIHRAARWENDRIMPA